MAHGVTTVPGHAHHSCPGGPAVVDVGVRQCSPLFLGLPVPEKAAPQEPPLQGPRPIGGRTVVSGGDDDHGACRRMMLLSGIQLNHATA